MEEQLFMGNWGWGGERDGRVGYVCDIEEITIWRKKAEGIIENSNLNIF